MVHPQVWIKSEYHRKIKILAARKGKTILEMMKEITDEYFSHHKKPHKPEKKRKKEKGRAERITILEETLRKIRKRAKQEKKTIRRKMEEIIEFHLKPHKRRGKGWKGEMRKRSGRK